MKQYKLITIIILASLLSGCIPMPEIEKPCYNATSYTGEKTVYKSMVPNVDFIKSNNDKYMSIEINPSAYWLSGRSTDGKFLNAKLTLINNLNQKIISDCNSLTYKVYSREDGSYDGILPSFQCNDDKLTTKLENFVRHSTFIKGTLSFDVFTRLNLKKRREIITLGRYSKYPYLQPNNIISFKLENKDISNYLNNGLNRGSQGGTCWNSKPYDEILSGYGSIHFHKLSNTDRKTKTTLLKKPRRTSNLMRFVNKVQLDESIRLQAQISFGEALNKYGGIKGVNQNKEKVKALMKKNCNHLAKKQRYLSEQDNYNYTFSNCMNLSLQELR